MNLLSDAAQSQTWKDIKPYIVRTLELAIRSAIRSTIRSAIRSAIRSTIRLRSL